MIMWIFIAKRDQMMYVCGGLALEYFKIRAHIQHSMNTCASSIYGKNILEELSDREVLLKIESEATIEMGAATVLFFFPPKISE